MTIEVQRLEKSFGAQKVVDDVSFDVADGEFVALLGPSGGGKSTVLRMIAGLETPDRGHVLIADRDATDDPVQARAVGFVFQHYALFKHMTVRGNIAFGLEVRGAKKAAIAAAVDELLALVQLEGLGDRYPNELSGGQRQRVALARALAPRPSILLLDEPFGALDSKVRIELRSWLRRLQRERAITSLFVTHDQDEAMELADRVVILAGGRVEQIGTPEDVYDRPATPFVASFVGTSNVLSGVVSAGKAAAGPFRMAAPREAPDGRDVRAYVRHHHIEIVPKGSELPPDTSFARARVERISRVGWVAKVELAIASGERVIAELPKQQLAGIGIVEGDDVRVLFRDAAVFVDDAGTGDYEI